MLAGGRVGGVAGGLLVGTDKVGTRVGVGGCGNSEEVGWGRVGPAHGWAPGSAGPTHG